MPKGHYQRAAKRGPYKRQNGIMVKRVIYLTEKQYEFLKEEAKNLGISYSEFLRRIIDNYGNVVDFDK